MSSKPSHDDLLAELSSAASVPWAMAPERATAISGILAAITSGRDVSPSRLQAALAVRGQGRGSDVQTQGGVAIVPISGVCLYGLHFPPLATSMTWLRQTMNELAHDKRISRIILNVGSPGGTVTGVPEAGDAIYAARQGTSIKAVVNPLCASAAYWLSASAGEIISVPSGDTGSIGVYVLHTDMSEALAKEGIRPTFIKAGARKTDANNFEPLSDIARADLQKDVDAIHFQFAMHVARGRGVTAGHVLEKFGEGRCLNARDALRVGMIDKIGNFETALPAPSQQQRRISGEPTLGDVLGAALTRAKAKAKA